MSVNAGGSATVRFEVPFHDVDSLRVVWHGHYMKYFELARDALLKSRGLGIDFWATSDYQLVVVDTRCRHTHPLRLGETVSVTARFVEVPGRIGISYQVIGETSGRPAARGRTDLAAIRLDGTLLMPLPEALHARTRP
ncbi:MAG: acyl-CoA thioesterase [Polyangiaceae bacterium]|nr:acyl-CoA thioesterase [Polyangiaceae bacterium]